MATTSTVPYINEQIGIFMISKEIVQGIPNWSFTLNGGSTTTFTIDTTDGLTHNNNIAAMVADYFNGAQIVVVTASNLTVGTTYDITDSAISGGVVTLTVATMSAAAAASDTIYVTWPMKASGISVSLGYESIERDFVRQTLDKPSPLVGLKTCSGSFDVELPGLETPSADGTAAGIDRYAGLLSVIGTRTAPVGEAVIAGTLGVSTFTVTDASTFTVGDLVMVNGECRKVTTVNTAAIPDELTVAPALSAAPVATDIVYSGETWTPDDEGHQTLTMLYQKDDRLIEVRGAVCSLKLSAEFGNFPKLSVEFDAAYIDSSGNMNGWDLQDAFTAFDGSHPTKLPFVFRRCSAKHFGSATMTMRQVEFDLGHGRSEHRYCDQHHFSITSRAASAAVNFKDVAVTPKESWEANATQGELLLGIGNSAGDAILISGNAVATETGMENSNEFSDWSATFQFVDDQTDSATPKKPKLTRF